MPAAEDPPGGLDIKIFWSLSRQIARAFAVPIFQVESRLQDEPSNAKAVAKAHALLASFCAV